MGRRITFYVPKKTPTVTQEKSSATYRQKSSDRKRYRETPITRDDIKKRLPVKNKIHKSKDFQQNLKK